MYDSAFGFCCFVLLVASYTVFFVTLFSEDGWFTKRQLEKKLRDIEYYNTKLPTKNLTFNYRDKDFTVTVKRGKVDVTSPTKSLEVYINDELSATMYIFTAGCFIHCRSFKAAYNRYSHEVIKIINKARRVYSKRANEVILFEITNNTTTKSYFK
jgi:hypothetical protein